MQEIHSTPLLEAEASRGNLKFWRGIVVTDGVNYYTQTESYQRTSDGSDSIHNLSTPKKVMPKNVGRSNETTSKEQAVAETDSHMNRKLDKGYYEHGKPKPEALPLPMLAHPYEKRKHNITWPAFLQPKLDGARMLFDGKRGWSRQGKPMIAECIEHLLIPDMPEGIILDGELMLDHDAFTFQETIAAIKKYRPDVSPKLRYHVYDLMLSPELTFGERSSYLDRLFASYNGDGPFVHVETRLVKDEAEMKAWHEQFVSRGFEGSILRNAGGLYKTEHRSVDLLKVKDFQDDEFEIVGAVEGQAKDAGTIIFVCRTKGGKEFNVRPRGTHAQRSQWWEARNELIGRELKVRYQNLTDDNVPRFPVGIEIRERDLEG